MEEINLKAMNKDELIKLLEANGIGTISTKDKVTQVFEDTMRQIENASEEKESRISKRRKTLNLFISNECKAFYVKANEFKARFKKETGFDYNEFKNLLQKQVNVYDTTNAQVKAYDNSSNAWHSAFSSISNYPGA